MAASVRTPSRKGGAGARETAESSVFIRTGECCTHVQLLRKSPPGFEEGEAPAEPFSSEMASAALMYNWCENPFSHPLLRESPPACHPPSHGVRQVI
jgi:hypothetical protein